MSDLLPLDAALANVEKAQRALADATHEAARAQQEYVEALGHLLAAEDVDA